MRDIWSTRTPHLCYIWTWPSLWKYRTLERKNRIEHFMSCTESIFSLWQRSMQEFLSNVLLLVSSTNFVVWKSYFRLDFCNLQYLNRISFLISKIVKDEIHSYFGRHFHEISSISQLLYSKAMLTMLAMFNYIQRQCWWKLMKMTQVFLLPLGNCLFFTNWFWFLLPVSKL